MAAKMKKITRYIHFKSKKVLVQYEDQLPFHKKGDPILLGEDKYIVQDIEDFQHSSKPIDGKITTKHKKERIMPYLRDITLAPEGQGIDTSRLKNRSEPIRLIPPKIQEGVAPHSSIQAFPTRAHGSASSPPSLAEKGKSAKDVL